MTAPTLDEQIVDQKIAVLIAAARTAPEQNVVDRELAVEKAKLASLQSLKAAQEGLPEPVAMVYRGPLDTPDVAPRVTWNKWPAHATKLYGPELFTLAVNLKAELAEAQRKVEALRIIAWNWGQGVTDAEAAIRQIHKHFPIDAAIDKARGV